MLAFAAALAQAPFAAGLVTDGLSRDGNLTGERIAAALGEPARHGLLRRVVDGEPQQWQLHPRVAEVVRDTLDPDLCRQAPLAAAAAVTARLGVEVESWTLHRYARALAGHPSVPRQQRVTLLRTEATLHATRGDAPSARDAIAAAISAAADDWLLDDVLLAGRLAVDAQHGSAAVQHADSAPAACHRHRRPSWRVPSPVAHREGARPARRLPRRGRGVRSDIPSWLAGQERGEVLVARPSPYGCVAGIVSRSR